LDFVTRSSNQRKPALLRVVRIALIQQRILQEIGRAHV